MPPVAVDPRFASVERLFFVVGAQKSGTTWLQNYLRQHPEVAVPVLKETNYWPLTEGVVHDDHLKAMLARTFGAGLKGRVNRLLPGPRKERVQREGLRLADRLRRAVGPPHRAYADVLFQLAGPATRAVGEICPQYARLRPETYRAMADLHPETRFAFLMRDPVDRLLSSIRHKLRRQPSAGAPDEGMIAAEVDRCLDGQAPGLVARSRYDETLAALDTAVGPDRLAVFVYEAFFEQSQVDRFCDFIGVSHRPGKVDNVVHRGTGADVPVSQERKDALRLLLDPTYEALRARLGTLPEAWMTRPAAGAGAGARPLDVAGSDRAATGPAG